MKYLKNEILLLLIVFMVMTLFSLSHSEDHSGKWFFTEGESNPDTVAQISQKSNTSIINESASDEVFPNLTFYCTKKNPNLLLQINWKRFISSFRKTEVGLQVDNEKMTWIKFNVDKTGKTTRQDSVSESQLLINKLLGQALLRVEVEPYSEPAVSVEFNLQNFEIYIEKLRDACST
ncbi:MAG: hypothetical protein VYC67_00300 [Pseudomonadota bacterium]|nr:hypothetical protein [Pseudomonadota bacterium]